MLIHKTLISTNLNSQFRKKGSETYMEEEEDDNQLKFVMFPWFAMGHLTIFLHISNHLADRRHRVFFIHPQNSHSKLADFNGHPDLITFLPITVPSVPGLPSGTETTADIPFPLYNLLRHALDLTRPTVEAILRDLRPHFAFFDFAHWLPTEARPLGVRSIHYCSINPAAVAFLFRDEPSVDRYREPPEGFPQSSAIRLHMCEARAVHAISNWREVGSEMRYVERMIAVNREADAIGFRSCREIEASYLEFLEGRFQKPVLLAGPVLPDRVDSSEPYEWKNFLDQLRPNSAIYCAFGSEARLKIDLFQELLLGLELTGLPFLVALKPPAEVDSFQDALPDNFADRVSGRGALAEGWVNQPAILSHPAVGCFVTHCGWNSISEAVALSDCQLVLLPHVGDQWVNARLVAGDLRAGVEVEKGDEDGRFTRDGVARAVAVAMEGGGGVAEEIRVNRRRWRDLLTRDGLENSYMDDFVLQLRSLLKR